MKRLLFAGTLGFVLAILGPKDLSGQSHAIDQGSFLIGGGASLTSTEFTIFSGTNDGGAKSKSSELSVRPSVQYFLIPGLALGGVVSIVRSKPVRWSLSGGPAFTYFFLRRPGPWHPYLSGSFQIGKTWLSDTVFGDSKDPTVHSYRGALGAVFMVSRGVGIHTEAFYDQSESNQGPSPASTSSNEDRRVEQKSYGLSVGITVFVFS